MIGALTLIGVITTAVYMFRAALWLWKTRKDKGYNASKYGAF